MRTTDESSIAGSLAHWLVGWMAGNVTTYRTYPDLIDRNINISEYLDKTRLGSAFFGILSVCVFVFGIWSGPWFGLAWVSYVTVARICRLLQDVSGCVGNVHQSSGFWLTVLVGIRMRSSLSCRPMDVGRAAEPSKPRLRLAPKPKTYRDNDKWTRLLRSS
ncbi:uncharacterized protein LOC117900869 [Drosophila subobscura]|uniref:uncharacterized protein LOC117900869 n=1 Tax=Drosophila subobscura TaxID=7241 RepID=UPI00155A6B51|nr:uncharacterized protein LOC117900869 [Drosophila subobscura]